MPPVILLMTGGIVDTAMEIVTLDITQNREEITNMKRKKLVSLFLLLVLIATACGKKEAVDTEARINSLMKELQEAQETIATKIEEKEKVQKELDEVKEVLQSTEDELKKTAETLDELKKQYENDHKEFTAYKEKMSAYEDLSETEKQAREAEARMMIQKEVEEQQRKIAEVEEERRKEMEKRQKEEREKAKKDFNTGITYDQIARTPDKYKNEKVKFTGKILQVFEGDSQNEMRLLVHKNEYGHYDSSQVIYCVYSPKLLDYRLLDGDIVTIYAVAQGLASSQVGGGRTTSIPLVYVRIIERKQ
jgi:DNA repair exonuclease SbcCD ATPase subunit